MAPEVLKRTPLDPRDLLEIEHHLLKFQTARGRRAYAVVNVNAPNPTPTGKSAVTKRRASKGKRALGDHGQRGAR